MARELGANTSRDAGRASEKAREAAERAELGGHSRAEVFAIRDRCEAATLRGWAAVHEKLIVREFGGRDD